VTVKQFSAFVNETGYDAGSKCFTWVNGKWEETEGRSWRNPSFSQDDTYPAVCLNWNDAEAYAARLSRKTGKAYRLLTEAEWEYAARAGSTTRYYFGDDEKDFCRYGNGGDQTQKRSGWTGTFLPCADGYLYTAPAGSFLPNAFGLYDMHGNAWHWVEDCYQDSYEDAPSDGSAIIIADCSRRVIRGGSWNSGPRNLRSANRSWNSTGYRDSILGFRVGRTLTP